MLAACVLVAGFVPWGLESRVGIWRSASSGEANPPMHRCPVLHPPDCEPGICNASILAVVSRAAEEVEWARNLPVPYTIVQKAGNHTLRRHHPVHSRLVSNTAFESTSYLTYIVDEYDRLPELLIFLHAHDRSWHQEGKITDHLCAQLRAFVVGHATHASLNVYALDSFNTHPNVLRTRMIVESGLWDAVLAPTFGEAAALTAFQAARRPMCCAQFIATRGAVQRLPREFYSRFLTWLLRTGAEMRMRAAACTSMYKPSASAQPVPCVTSCQDGRYLGYSDGVLACYITKDLQWHAACQPSLECTPDFYTSRFAEWLWEFIFTAEKLGPSR